MPKTTKPFDWEVYQNDDFLDVLTMTRSEASEYRKSHPDYTLIEIGYSDDGGDDSWNSNSKEKFDVHRVCRKKRRGNPKNGNSIA